MALAVIAGCSSMTSPSLRTLDGHQPLVIAHRGASGYLPEHTLEAYQRAIELGADAIEPDLISTQDGVLIASHYPNLAINTDVASRPEFTSRKRENWPIDGELQTGWFAHDFTLAEIKTLGVVATEPERPQQYNGKFRIVTLQEVIDLVKVESKRRGRVIAIYPESKNPTYLRELGLPLEDKLLGAIQSAGWNSRTAPVFVQSVEPGSLQELRAKGLKVRMVQLIDADEYDFETGGVRYAPPFHRLYDWETAGDQRLFADMVTHRLGLFVHAFTFRNEDRFLSGSYLGDPQAEYLQFFRLGVDGVFSEFPDTANAAR